MILENLKQIDHCEACGEIIFKEKFIDAKYHFIEGYLLEVSGKELEIKGCKICLNSFLKQYHQYILEQSDDAKEHVIVFRPEVKTGESLLLSKIKNNLKNFSPNKIKPKLKKGKKYESNYSQGSIGQ